MAIRFDILKSAVGVAALCAAAFWGAQASAQDAYKVGVVLPLSGVGSANADGANQGITAALDVINAGNLAGRNVEIIVADDASDPRTAGEVCNRLVLQDKVNAIISANPTPGRVACNQVAAKAGIPHLAAATSPGNICFPNMFTVGQVNNQLVVPLIDYLVKNGMKRVLFYGSDYAAPRAGYEIAKAETVKLGGEDLGGIFAPLGQADFSADLGKIAQAKPDVVLSSVQGADNVTFHRQFGEDPRLAGIKRADNFLTTSTAKMLGANGVGIYLATGYFASLDLPDNAAFKEALEKKFPGKANPDIWAVLGYNAMHLLAQSVKATDGSPEAVIKALTTASFDGPNGHVQIKDYYAASPTYIAETTADGSATILEQSTIDPIVAKCQ